MEAIRIGARRLGASTIRLAPRYIPTWWMVRRSLVSLA
jgi:hypothetical protein